ncbi:MAG: putative mucin/carbohydrate-binding domain-containing protein [Arachnia sp.]
MRPVALPRLLMILLLLVPLALSGSLPARAEIGALTVRVLTPLAAGNDAITRAGVQRGRGMERESLGLALSAGAVVEARVTNGVTNVSLSLMTDDHTTDVESSNGYQPGDTRLPVDGSWQRITAVAASGVFARTRAWTTAPRIEYRVASGSSFAMPEYRMGGSQQGFVSAWQASASPFAVVVDRSFTLLLPRVDLPKVADMGWSHFADLDDAIGFYRQLMSSYDTWLGVSDSDPSPLHRNLPQAPFMRPDRTGWGLAYYSGGNYIGTNIGSVSYYLEGPESWLILHEIGHGYDGIMTNTAGPDDIQLGEVWNNVYGYQYQTLVNGVTGPNWLNDTSKPVNQQRRDDARRRAGGVVKFNDLGYQDKLDFVARIADLTGTDGFSRFNRSLRELQASPSFKSWPARKDLIAQRWGGAEGHNLAPWFGAYGLPVATAAAEDLYDVRQLPIALPLSDLFDDAARTRSAAAQLGLDSPGALVSSTRTATLDATGAIRVTAATTAPADVEGRLVSLWRGATEVATAPFRDGVADFTGVPLGAHTLRFPLSRTTGVVPQRQWVASRQSGTPSAVTVNYPAVAVPPALNNSLLTLRGLGDAVFAAVEHDTTTSRITITDTLNAPHSYFPNNQYAKITVSAGTQVLFERSFIGDQKRNASASTTVAAAQGTTITITHLEPNRIDETNPATGYPRPVLNATDPTTTWRVTDQGLVKLDDIGNWDEGAAGREHVASLTAALSDFAATAGAHPGAQLAARAASLRTAVDQLTSASDRQSLAATYGAVLAAQIAKADRPAPTPSPTPSPSPVVTPTASPTPAVSPTPVVTSTASPTSMPSPTSSATSSASPTPSPSTTTSPTSSASTVPTTTRPTATPTKSVAPTVAPTRAPSTPAPFDVYSTPGYHTVNGRQWFTSCEAYSKTQRRRTEIWGTTVVLLGGRFVTTSGWQFNNLTYLPSPRALWAGNPLGNTTTWTATDGRQWRTECDTALTGRNGCRTWSVAKVVQTTRTSGGVNTYRVASVEVFNNIVRFR